MSEIPRYVATCDGHDEHLAYYGQGETPDEAVADFAGTFGELADWAEHWGVDAGEEVEVEVYHAVHPSESDWDEETVKENGWAWVCDGLVRTERVPIPAATTRT